ncbi:MAG: relaxase/mobilization nuclease domain-containing protein, partial [Blastocatellia bacterium]
TKRMATPTPIAKVSIGKAGYGAAHASYITRMSALDPEQTRARNTPEEMPYQPSFFALDERGNGELSARPALEENLNERTLGEGKEHGAADIDHSPIWTWNAPEFLTGEFHGSRRDIGRDDSAGKERRDGPDKLTLQEKVQNVKDYFVSLEEYERKKGGRTHYRIILSFDVAATNEQIRNLTNKFLETAFPKAIAFAAIHRETDHPHVHVYLNSRQVDGKRIQLKNNEFKTIDEKWATIYSEFAGDKSVYLEYMKKKEETRQWKISAADAYRNGKPVPPKPERDNDRRERLAEQRLSAERTRTRDKGAEPQSRPQVETISRPASERETARLLAKAEVAREQLAHLVRTDAADKEIKAASRTAHEFAVALDKTRAARKEMGRERMPQVVYTTEEWKRLKEYQASRDLPAKDDHAAARLQPAQVMAGAELKDAQGSLTLFR